MFAGSREYRPHNMGKKWDPECGSGKMCLSEEVFA